MAGLEYVVYKGSPTGRIVKSTTRRPPLGDDEVLINTTHSGLCGTDEHYKQQDMVLGHEGVGTINAVGSKVKLFKIGDRVGWGYCHGSCGRCWACSTGKNLYCDERQLYGFANFDQGSFSFQAVWPESSLFRVPDSLDSAYAAPLMCAGAAVYSAIRRANVRPADRVGILGMGGLGHLAIQFAASMGCQVVVLSTSFDKKGEAMSYGAHEFHGPGDKVNADGQKPVDCMLITSGKMPNWRDVIPWIRRGGTISAMTVDPDELQLPYMDLVMNAIQIQGSLPAPTQMHREMLEFAALHKIHPTIEEFPLTEDGINEAMEKLRKGGMRYRGVLVKQ